MKLRNVWIILALLILLALVALLVVADVRRAVPHRRGTVAEAAVPDEVEPPAPRPGPTPTEQVRKPLPLPIASLDEEQLSELEEQAAELARDEAYEVICTIEPNLAEAPAYLAVGDPTEFDGRIVKVLLGRAYLPLLGGEGEGVLSVQGYAPTTVRWTAPADGEHGTCQPDPVQLQPGGTAITGTVTHEGTGEPAVEAWVEGCGGLSFTDEDGIYYMEVVAGPCAIMAMRQDGMLRTISPPIDVTPKAGEDVVVDIQIPAFRRAGLGVAIREHDEGFEVFQVIEGSGSADAGIQEGDIVVEIDGTPAAELDLEGFIELAGGQAGSQVDLLVLRDGERQPVTIDRRELN